MWMWLPDTNALYDRPELHKWPASNPTLLVIAPTVINELDAHKQDGRNQDRQRKARTLTEQIRDIRRRTGQTINGNLQLHPVATWNRRWEEMPNWLDRGHADDQILALGIELAWSALTSAVTLVSSDANLHIKAERVGIAYVDQDQPNRLVALVTVVAAGGVYRALRHVIYANFNRQPGDRFLAVDGFEALLQTHIDQGAVERA
jgi:predicted ribonuclease YlaK